MTRDEFKAVAARLRAVYAKDFMPDKEAYDTWYLLLEDLPIGVVQAAALRYMQTGKFAPTPADIRQIAAEIMTPPEEELTGEEAWSLVSAAICNSIYHSQEQYDRLPRTVRRAVGSPGNLREWAMTDLGEIQTVVHSQFLKTYRAVMEQSRRDAATSQGVRGQIGRIRQEAGIEGGEAAKITSA